MIGRCDGCGKRRALHILTDTYTLDERGVPDAWTEGEHLCVWCDVAAGGVTVRRGVWWELTRERGGLVTYSLGGLLWALLLVGALLVCAVL